MARKAGVRLLTVSEYAAAVGIHRVSAYERIRSGKVRYRKAYGRIRVFPDQIQVARVLPEASPVEENTETVREFAERLVREMRLG
jgi:hypothetical protein